jgi:hypothetical protein
MQPIDLQDDPLVLAIMAIIAKALQMGMASEDASILDALAYVYACFERHNDGTRPHKLN